MEKIISDLKKTAISAAQKTGELVEIGKLKFALSNTKGKIDEKYKDLGLALYTAHKNSNEDAQSLDEIIAQIDDLFLEQAKLESEIGALKSQKKCPSCGRVCDDDASFCASCGEKF
ncbi:MAG: zinc ribbon domain-containing protein [Ruminococcaceae bacterium]|nr:zinc ribbon domain-containing protein [Oscillospiraceae bacterium]